MIAIVGGCGTNIASIQFALERLGKTSFITTDAKALRKATHVILPGVGAAKATMEKLQKLKLIDVLKKLQQPVLGICLGMQLFYEFSAEGNVECLGIFPGKISNFPVSPNLIIPHMGWNQLEINCTHSLLLQGVPNQSYVYYVHSYIAGLNAKTIATSQHGIAFTAACENENFYGVQFHPERSGKIGETILENFLNLE